MGNKKGIVQGEKTGEFAGNLEGIAKGRKEGLEQGEKETEINVETFALNKNPESYLVKLSNEEYHRKLFTYPLERKVIRDACKIVIQDYLDNPKDQNQALQYSLLATKCNAEIGLIEQIFKDHKY